MHTITVTSDADWLCFVVVCGSWSSGVCAGHLRSCAAGLPQQEERLAEGRLL